MPRNLGNRVSNKLYLSVKKQYITLPGISIEKPGGEDMAYWSRELVLAEDQGSIPST